MQHSTGLHVLGWPVPGRSSSWPACRPSNARLPLDLAWLHAAGWLERAIGPITTLTPAAPFAAGERVFSVHLPDPAPRHQRCGESACGYAGAPQRTESTARRPALTRLNPHLPFARPAARGRGRQHAALPMDHANRNVVTGDGGDTHLFHRCGCRRHRSIPASPSAHRAAVPGWSPEKVPKQIVLMRRRRRDLLEGPRNARRRGAGPPQATSLGAAFTRLANGCRRYKPSTRTPDVPRMMTPHGCHPSPAAPACWRQRYRQRRRRTADGVQVDGVPSPLVDGSLVFAPGRGRAPVTELNYRQILLRSWRAGYLAGV